MYAKHVLMLTARFWPTIGGAQTHVFELSQNLAQLGFSVTIIAEKDPPHLPFHERIGQVDIYRAPIRGALFLLFPAYILLALLIQRRVKARIVHAHFALPCGLVGLLIRTLCRLPLVITVHGIDIVKEASVGYGIRLNPFLDWLTSRVLRRADRIIVCSHFVRRLVLKCRVETDRISLIPNGIRVPKLDSRIHSERKSFRERLGLPTTSLLLLTARRLVPKNGVEYLIRASGILANSGIDFHVAVVGSGPLRQSLERLSEQLAVAPRISFLGQVDREKLEELYLASDLVILPSIVEAFGLPVLEAMAYRRPIVTFNSGGPAEIVQREATGLVLRQRNASALADAVFKLANEPALVRAIERRCAAAIRKYSWDKIAQETIQVYGQLLTVETAQTFQAI